MSFLAKVKSLFGTKLTLKDSPAQRKVDYLQTFMATLPQLDLSLVHRFTPGLYTRTCTLPKGSITISKIHKTQHPFVLTKGEASVWTEGTGIVRIKAPMIGITNPGTRRVIYAHEDTEWSTFHATEETDLAKIEDAVIEKRAVDCSLDSTPFYALK